MLVSKRSDFDPPREWWSLLCAQERNLVSYLCSGIVHDLNNALSTLQTNAYLLRDSSGERREIVEELDASVEQGIAIAAQLRTLSFKPPPGPAAHPAQDLLATLQQAFSQAFDEQRFLTALRAPAGECWIPAPLGECVLSTCLLLLLGVVPATNATVAVDAQLAGGGELLFTVSAVHPLLSASPQDLDPRRAWLADAHANRMAKALALRAGGQLELVSAPAGALGFQVLLPVLSDQQVRAVTARLAKQREKSNDVS